MTWTRHRVRSTTSFRLRTRRALLETRATEPAQAEPTRRTRRLRDRDMTSAPGVPRRREPTMFRRVSALERPTPMRFARLGRGDLHLEALGDPARRGREPR